MKRFGIFPNSRGYTFLCIFRENSFCFYGIFEPKNHTRNRPLCARNRPLCALDERKLTHTLWQMCTECIVVFPDGVGVLPWMVCGTNEIGLATAEKMREFRLVVWGMHGIYGAGETPDEAFGLIETVEKAAQIYMLTAHLPRINTIRDGELVQLAEAFGVDYRKDFL